MIIQRTTRTYRYPLVAMLTLVVSGSVFLSSGKSESMSVDVKEEYPYVIPIEMYETSWSSFQTGDEIIVTELRGTSPEIREGASYRVTGTYSLISQDSAMLHVYATNGEIKSKQGDNVAQGSGTYAREFTLAKDGMLHLSYYPSDGGDGFGGIYFRVKPRIAGASGAIVDFVVFDADLVVAESTGGD